MEIEDTKNEDVTDIETKLDEASPPKATATKKDGTAEGSITEPESIAASDKIEKGTGRAKHPGGPQGKGKGPMTTAAMINALYKNMKTLNKEELEVLVTDMMGEGVEIDEVETETVNTSDELDALVESEATLSEEFKAKTAILFETAVTAKVGEEIDRLEEQYTTELSEEVATIKSELVEKVDSYLNYVVETWMEDNKVAIESGLRTEISENFMDKLKDLFTESYISVPEAKVDLVDELSASVEELETKLNDTTGTMIEQKEELETYKRDAVIAEACSDLADTEIEKIKGLVEGFDFEDEASFTERVAVVKESYFNKTSTTSDAETVLENNMDHSEEADVVEVSDEMSKYVNTLGKMATKT
jgi:hypothetical protein